MSVDGDTAVAVNFDNILKATSFKTNRRYELPRNIKKRTYNSLKDEDYKIKKHHEIVEIEDDTSTEAWAQYQRLITIAERTITGSLNIEISIMDEMTLQKDEKITGLENGYLFQLPDITLELPDFSNQLTVSSIPKKRLKKLELMQIPINVDDVPTMLNEIEIFKPLRLYERSGYVKINDPVLNLQLTEVDDESLAESYELSFEIKYSIQMKECCLYVHPLRATYQINNLLDDIIKWCPALYETPYTKSEIKLKGYNKITSSTFYNLISDSKTRDAVAKLNKPLIIPELDAELFNFQNGSVNWLLQREGVCYDEQTHSVQEIEFFPKLQSDDDNKIGECLDRLCFGWSRVTLPNFESNKDIGSQFWYNKYTGNITSSKFASHYLATINSVPALGLLAEEMGLGKTVEVLGLVLLNQRRTNQIDKTVWDSTSQREIFTAKTTLIICPDAILKQWYHEINNLASNLRISIYKGIYSYNKTNSNDIHAKNYKTPLQIAKHLSKFDIVLASYQTVAREIHHALYNPSSRPKRKCAKVSRSKILTTLIEKDEDGNIIKEIMEEEFDDIDERNDYSSPLVLLQFWRVVLDEVQMVSSKISNAAKIAKIIPRYHSWGVSGTPIRKDLNDLHSFLVFAQLYPFNDSLPSPKASRMVWSRLVDDTHIPTDFIRLFKLISLRHTKAMVSDEINLPPQKRVLFITDFTPIERNLYDHMFEEFLSTVSLNDRGDPLIDNWEPNSTILSYMREWLIKLRQTCCHSQIGTGSIIRRALGKNEDMHLRTVDAVLDLLVEDNENAIASSERRFVLAKIEKGQLYEFHNKPLKALEVWEECLPTTNQRISLLRADLLKWETRLKTPQLSKEDEQSFVDKLTQLRMKLRSWSEILHRLYFFIASAHFQIYSPKEEPKEEDLDLDLPEVKKEIDVESLSPEDKEHYKLENEYYDKAELLRRELLSEPIGKVNKLVKQIMAVDLNQYMFPKIEEKEMELIGIEAIFFRERFKNLVGELNEQSKVMNQWFRELTSLLSKVLQDNPKGETERLDDDYEESLTIQDQAYAYLDVLQKMLKDRNDALTGLNDRSLVTNMIQRKLDEEDITIMKTATGRSDFHKELESLRKKMRPSATIDLELSLRTMILKAKELSDFMNSSGVITLEFKLFNAFSVDLKKTLDSQKKILNKVKKDYFGQLNDLYNTRIEYYKSLQALSDNVKGYELQTISTFGAFRYNSDEEFRHSVIDKRILEYESARKNAAIRTKYLKSLKNVGSHDSEEDRFCIICRSAIVTGVLTACGHQYCKECLDEWLKQNRKNCPMCKSHLDKDSIYNFTYTRSNLKGSLVTGEKSSVNRDMNKIMHSIYQPIDDDIVRKIGNIEIVKSYGSKIDLIIKLIKYLMEQEKDVQIVIFSQWSELLYLIGVALKYNKIQYLNSNETLNTHIGSGRRLRKLTDVDTFKKTKTITCFLLNAKAQASGLTLVNASHVFLCEPLINTSLELQAISRIHRIGQKKATTIWMFAISNTVEESIVKLSTKKRLEYLHGVKKPESQESSDITTSTESDDIYDSSNIDESQIDSANTQELTKTMEGLVDKKLFGGEVVPNDDLWLSFFS